MTPLSPLAGRGRCRAAAAGEGDSPNASGQLIVLSTNPSCIKRRWDADRSSKREREFDPTQACRNSSIGQSFGPIETVGLTLDTHLAVLVRAQPSARSRFLTDRGHFTVCKKSQPSAQRKTPSPLSNEYWCFGDDQTIRPDHEPRPDVRPRWRPGPWSRSVEALARPRSSGQRAPATL